MSLSNDINSIIKTKKIKQPLKVLPAKKEIEHVKGVSDNSNTAQVTSFTPPLTLEVLTYDAAADVSIEANNGTFVIKTAETAQIIDADGKVFSIDTIIYATP